MEDDRLRLDPHSLEACIGVLDRSPEYPVPLGTLEVAFVDEDRCSQLHKDFFDDPDITDVMTFPGDPGDDHLGDIAICPAVAAGASGAAGLPFHEELTLYLVHAWLHLSGLRDDEPDARKQMRRAESILMDQLREAGALLDGEWLGA
jgi:probable rRNA maturation factor